MNAVRTHPPLPGRHDKIGREVVAEPARPVASGAMHDVLSALHDSFVMDDHLDDDLEMVVGAESALLTMAEVEKLIPRLHRTLRQLVNIAYRRADGTPGPELRDAANRAQRLEAEQTTRDFDSARGHLRLLALAALDVLELVAVEDTDTRLPDSGSSSSVLSGWSV